MSKIFTNGSVSTVNTKKENISASENSYILREYFKGFKIEGADLIKLKDKINKIERSLLLDCIIKQDEQVYDLVSENYSSSVEMVQFILYIV